MKKTKRFSCSTMNMVVALLCCCVVGCASQELVTARGVELAGGFVPDAATLSVMQQDGFYSEFYFRSSARVEYWSKDDDNPTPSYLYYAVESVTHRQCTYFIVGGWMEMTLLDDGRLALCRMSGERLAVPWMFEPVGHDPSAMPLRGTGPDERDFIPRDVPLADFLSLNSSHARADIRYDTNEIRGVFVKGRDVVVRVDDTDWHTVLSDCLSTCGFELRQDSGNTNAYHVVKKQE